MSNEVRGRRLNMLTLAYTMSEYKVGLTGKQAPEK